MSVANAHRETTRTGWRRDATPARSRAAAASLAALWFVATGCYVYRPVATAPPPGTVVAVSLNDRGRVALENNIGPEVARIQGAIVDTGGGSYVIAVRNVVSLHGRQARWDGERVTVREEFTRDVATRKLSRARSFTLATALLGAAAWFVVSRDLLGLGSGAKTSPGGGGPGPGT